MAERIALIDYGAGNLHSVANALKAAGAGTVEITASAAVVACADRIVLPGVGAFGACAAALRALPGMTEAMTVRVIGGGVPFLGICVGYQAMFERSEEFNSCAAGLGFFKGSVVRFPEGQGLKIPQIGWNQIEITQPDCPLYQDVEDGSHVYFVHSFHPKPEDESIAATRTTYGVDFVSSVWRDNVFATQFHPEKSQRVGLKILENFVGLAG